MPRGRRAAAGNGLDAWPGYVDALSTLLMVIIFVLLVFVLAQAFTGAALSGRSQALDTAKTQLAQLSDMLGGIQQRAAALQSANTGLESGLKDASARGDSLARDLEALRTRSKAEQAAAAEKLGAAQADAAEMRRQADALERTVAADRATIEARVSDLARLAEQTRALEALRDQMAGQITAADARAKASETEAARLADSGRAQVALLNQQTEALRKQLTDVSASLDLARTQAKDKDVKLTDLDAKLNAALAARVEELQRYRSEFFGRLREVLANKPGIQVVGDRFVFQSEVLFPAGSADLTQAGQTQLRALAATVRQIAAEIPPALGWVLRVDGHADRQPVDRGPFASNWELSAQRAINVAKLLASEGVPAEHLAATAFSDNQPLDPADTPEARARNRRIELRLTDR